MRSKTSFCNMTLLKTNAKRYFPLWLLYAIGMGLTVAIMFGDAVSSFTLCNIASGFFSGMAAVNFIYVFLLCQTLFGDLYNTRLCFGVHALPITRDSIFGTNVLLGFAASLIPNCVAAGAIAAILGSNWSIALWWLLAATLQFICFFGIGLLSVMCAGNRIGMMLVDGIINFLAVLVYWLAGSLYSPLIYGMGDPSNKILAFSPPYSMLTNDYLQLNASSGYNQAGQYFNQLNGYSLESGTWILLAVYAVVGILAGALALVLYRRRKLECAGDLLSIDKLKSVFLVLFALTVGGFFHVFSDLATGNRIHVFFLIGIVVGYYGGSMLLQRQANVFHLRSLLPLAGILAALAASLMIAASGWFGYAQRTFDASDVKSIQIGWYEPEMLTLTEPEDIAKALSIQEGFVQWYKASAANRGLLEPMNTHNALHDSEGQYHNFSILLLYVTLNNGKTVHREYMASDLISNYQDINDLFSRPEAIDLFRYKTSSGASYLDKTAAISVACPVDSQTEYTGDYEYTVPVVQESEAVVMEPAQVQALKEAILADCEDGNLAQHWLFHDVNDHELWFQIMDGTNVRSSDLRYSDSNVHITEWVAQNLHHSHPAQ